MALLGAAVVTMNLFAGCGSTGAEQTGNNADGTATEAVQGKDSAGDGRGDKNDTKSKIMLCHIHPENDGGHHLFYNRSQCLS